MVNRRSTMNDIRDTQRLVQGQAVPEHDPVLRAEVGCGALRGLSLAGALGLSHAGLAVAAALDIGNPVVLALLATLVFAIALMIIAADDAEARERGEALIAQLAS